METLLRPLEHTDDQRDDDADDDDDDESYVIKK